MVDFFLLDLGRPALWGKMIQCLGFFVRAGIHELKSLFLIGRVARIPLQCNGVHGCDTSPSRKLGRPIAHFQDRPEIPGYDSDRQPELVPVGALLCYPQRTSFSSVKTLSLLPENVQTLTLFAQSRPIKHKIPSTNQRQ